MSPTTDTYLRNRIAQGWGFGVWGVRFGGRSGGAGIEFWRLGCGVWCLGCGIRCLGCGVWGCLVFGVWRLVLSVWCVGFGVRNLWSRIWNLAFCGFRV